jgi:predicted ATPase
MAMQGQAAAGIAQIHQALATYRALVRGVALPHFLGLLAEAYDHAGQPAAGLTTLAEAQETIHRTGERWWAAELARLQGTLLLAQAGAGPHVGDAEACFQEALVCARQQQTKSLELRAAMSLARL